MAQVAFPEKQTLSRLAGKEVQKSILASLPMQGKAREGQGRGKDWQRGKLGCDGFSRKTALWNCEDETTLGDA